MYMIIWNRSGRSQQTGIHIKYERYLKLILRLCCSHRLSLAPGSGGDTQAVGPLTNVPKAAVLSAPTPSTAPASNLRPPITTHVLDVALGKPGSNIDVSLHFLTENSIAEGDQGSWTLVGNSQTDNDGRSGPLMQPSNYLQPGTYRITFNTGAYLARLHGNSGFYPCANVVFKVRPSQCAEHFHIPLLLAPYSYSTYRGS